MARQYTSLTESTKSSPIQIVVVDVINTVTMHFGVCKLIEDWSILLLLQNVNKTPMFLPFFQLLANKCIVTQPIFIFLS